MSMPWCPGGSSIHGRLQETMTFCEDSLMQVPRRQGWVSPAFLLYFCRKKVATDATVVKVNLQLVALQPCRLDGVTNVRHHQMSCYWGRVFTSPDEHPPMKILVCFLTAIAKIRWVNVSVQTI